MIVTSIDTEFTQCFDEIYNDKIDKNSIKYFCPLIDSNEFNYDSLIQKLMMYIPHYCLSHSTYQENINNPILLHHLTKEKFKNTKTNTGELAELIGYCFLESDLKAPKIVSKMELKTNKEMYIHGSDGVHFVKTEDGYQLIFVEAKSYKDLYQAIYKAIESIDKFKNGTNKNTNELETKGIEFEKSLISAHIANETFTQEDKEFVKKILYPTRDGIKNVDTSFAIIILYEPSLNNDLKNLPNNEYRKSVHSILKRQIEKKAETIKSLITNHKLNGHNFYFYIVPLENLEQSQYNILNKVLG